MLRAYHRQARGLGLDGHNAQSLEPAGEREHVHGPQQPLHAPGHAVENDAVRDVQRGGAGPELFFVRALPYQQQAGTRLPRQNGGEDVQQEFLIFLIAQAAHIADEHAVGAAQLRPSRLPLLRIEAEAGQGDAVGDECIASGSQVPLGKQEVRRIPGAGPERRGIVPQILPPHAVEQHLRPAQRAFPQGGVMAVGDADRHTGLHRQLGVI